MIRRNLVTRLLAVWTLALLVLPMASLADDDGDSDCSGDPVCLAFIDPIINRYGYLENGVPTGGGFVGYDDSIDQNDFFRESYQIGYDYLFGSDVTHELHVGYQWYEDGAPIGGATSGSGDEDAGDI